MIHNSQFPLSGGLIINLTLKNIGSLPSKLFLDERFKGVPQFELFLTENSNQGGGSLLDIQLSSDNACVQMLCDNEVDAYKCINSLVGMEYVTPIVMAEALGTIAEMQLPLADSIKEHLSGEIFFQDIPPLKKNNRSDTDCEGSKMKATLVELSPLIPTYEKLLEAESPADPIFPIRKSECRKGDELAQRRIRNVIQFFPSIKEGRVVAK